MGKPNKRQKIEAFQAFFDATSLEGKKKVLRQHRDVLLRKYGWLDEDISSVAIELMERQGTDVEGAIRYSHHMDLIDDARKKGVGKAISEAKKDPNKLEYLTGSPDDNGTVLASVIYMEDTNRSHPLMSDGDVVELMAYPSRIEVRKYRGKEELVSIPWGNVVNIYDHYKSKGTLGTIGADFTNMIWPAASYSHDGVVIQYKDPVFNSELAMFFRVRGKKNAQKLTKQLMQRLYKFRRKVGESGAPK